MKVNLACKATHRENCALCRTTWYFKRSNDSPQHDMIDPHAFMSWQISRRHARSRKRLHWQERFDRRRSFIPLLVLRGFFGKRQGPLACTSSIRNASNKSTGDCARIKYHKSGTRNTIVRAILTFSCRSIEGRFPMRSRLLSNDARGLLQGTRHRQAVNYWLRVHTP